MKSITPRAENILNEMSISQHIVDDVEVAFDENASAAVDCFD